MRKQGGKHIVIGGSGRLMCCEIVSHELVIARRSELILCSVGAPVRGVCWCFGILWCIDSIGGNRFDVQIGALVSILASALLVEITGLFGLLWHAGTGTGRHLGRREGSLVILSLRARKIYRRSSENAWEVFESHSKSGEFWVSGVVPNEGNFFAVVSVRDELVDVPDIMAAGEVDMPTLRVVDKLPE